MGRVPQSASEPSLLQPLPAAATAAAGGSGDSRASSPLPGQSRAGKGGGDAARRPDGGWAVPEAQEVTPPRGFVPPTAAQTPGYPALSAPQSRPAAAAAPSRSNAGTSRCHS